MVIVGATNKFNLYNLMQKTSQADHVSESNKCLRPTSWGCIRVESQVSEWGDDWLHSGESRNRLKV